MPLFDAGGTAARTISSADLLPLLPGDLAARVHLVDDASAPGWTPRLAAQIAPRTAAGDTLLVMGARDPELPALARELAAACAAKP